MVKTLLKTPSIALLSLLQAGRWALTLIETGLSIALILWYPQRPVGAFVAMALMAAYNIAVLVLLHRCSLENIPIRLALALDFLFLINVCYWTDGAHSPFVGLFHLLVLVSALLFGLKGGLLVGTGAGAIAVALNLATLNPIWELTRDTAPYFPILGGFTGFLTQRLQLWQERAVRRGSELELARTVQLSALSTAPPKSDVFEFLVRAEPSQEVGGDFALFLTPRPGLVGAALGDVAGKGLPAALVATSIGYLLPHLRAHGSPEAMLATLNADLSARLPAGSFVGMLYVELSESDGSATLWNAGHTPAWISVEGAFRESALGVAPPLGLFPAWSGTPERVALAPGALLVLCSDGLTETRNAAGEEFGPAHLQELLSARSDAPLEALADEILEAARRFGAPTDDITLLLCRRR